MPKINCPICGAFLQVDDDMIGTPVVCGGCAHEFVAAKPKPRYDYEQDDWSEDDEDRSRRSSARDDDDYNDDDGYDDEYDEEVDDFRRSRRYRRRQIPTDGKAIASLVLGIVALVCALGSFCTCGIGSFISIPCGVIGIILGVMGMKPGSKGLAIGGIATASVSIAITIATVIFMGLVFWRMPAPAPPPPPKMPVGVQPQFNNMNQNKPGLPKPPGLLNDF